MGNRKGLFPEIEPYNTGLLRVSDLHMMYYEQCGNKNGNPILFVHGGPGAGCFVNDRRFFDPETYRIILFDQRGVGRSTPKSELRENTTWDLVADMEKLREHLGISQWILFGGSWGSCLSLTYSQTHPSRVKAIILRGIFTHRRRETTFLLQDGTSMIFPDRFERYRDHIPEAERGDLISAYYRRLTGDDEEVLTAAAKEWTAWEMSCSRLFIDEPAIENAMKDETWCKQVARIESHYFVHGGFFKSDTQLLDGVDKISHLPITIVQGRYDVVCPPETAWLLHKKLPRADFEMVPAAGHSTKEAGILSKLVEATEKYKHL